MIGKYLGRFAIVAAAACAVVPAQATSFVFTSSSNSALSGTFGNSYGVTSGGITVTATAWSTSGLANTNLPGAAYLGRYTNGLGVTNSIEGNGTSNNSHSIDNVGSYDFVRLVFSQAVNLTGMTLVGYPVDGSSNNIDTDAWVSYGTGTGAFNTSSLWQGYIARGVDVNNGVGYSSANFSTVWLIGAARSTTDRDDGFKLAAITAVTQSIVPQVPEPATWLTMIFGFGLMGSTLRRRSTTALRTSVA